MTRPLPMPEVGANDAPGGGLWRVAGDAIVPVGGSAGSDPLLLVPSEQVLLLTADLPVQGLRRRAEALPFAIEDRIGAPLDQVHIALGAEIAPQRHLAGIVAHGAMARWVALAAAAGLDRVAIVPDALMLPVPPEGSWTVSLDDERARVRLPDGTGFALPEALLDQAWRAAGEPTRLAAGAIEVAPLPVDLRQGRYSRARMRLSLTWRRAAAVAVAGLVAHGAIAAADTLALRHIAAQRASVARAAIERVAPGAAAGDDLAATAADILPASGAGPSHFLPLLARTATALRPLGSGASFRSVSFDAGADTLGIEIEAADLAALQRVSGALAAGGLAAESGAASQSGGKAIGAFLIRGAK